MPYAIEKKGSKFVVRNTDTGDVKGTHDSREKAQRQVNLLRGVEHGWKPTGAPAKK
jgi:hypothetical protein